MSVPDGLDRAHENTLLYFLEDPVVVLSAKGAVAYVNPSFRSRFAVRKKEVVGRHFSESIPQWMWEPVLARLRVMEPGGAAHNFWLKNGQERFRVSMADIALSGRVAGAVVTLWDASREGEQRLKNLELFRAMLEDLEQPLTKLKDVMDGPLDKLKGRKTMSSGVEHIEEALSRFRDFAELLLGEVRTERVPFFPGRLIALARKSLRPLAEQRGVYLEEGMARELPRVQGDPALLNRVLGLLVDYMVKAVPVKEIVVISADLLLMSNGSPWLSYSITGTGFVGLETELLEEKAPLLETFKGLPDERKRLVLRLMLARRLVTAMGGMVSVAGHKLAGTSISVRVPVELHISSGG
jgi:signal transduction histidine kinase